MPTDEKELAKIGFVVKNKVDQIAKLEDRNERETSDIETEAGQVLEKYSDSSYQLNPHCYSAFLYYLIYLEINNSKNQTDLQQRTNMLQR